MSYIEMKNETLNPCYLCGGRVELEYQRSKDKNDPVPKWSVRCQVCALKSGNFFTIDAVVDFWNAPRGGEE